MATRFPMVIVNQSIPIVVQMFPNPRNMSIESAKVFSQTQTLGGWVYEHWGEKPQVIRVKGRTQGLRGNFDNEISIEAALFQLQQLYRLDKRETLSILPRMKDISDLGLSGGLSSSVDRFKKGLMDPSALRDLSSTFIYYRYDVYAGFFTRFHWEQDAESTPRHYEYDFEFLATSTAQNWLADKLFIPSSAIQAAAVAAFGTTASAATVLNTVKGIVNLGNSKGST